MAKRSKPPKHHHQQQSASQGFMEPTAGATHREDIYGISQFEQDRVESYAFDVCDDEDDEDEEDAHGGIGETMFKRRGAISGPSSGSRGVIRKPTCKGFQVKHRGSQPALVQTILTFHIDKPRSELSPGNEGNPLDLTSDADDNEIPNPHGWFKISPRQNPKHSVSITPAVSEENNPDPISQDVDETPSPTTTSPSTLKAQRNAEAFPTEKIRQHNLASSIRFELVRKQRRQDRMKRHAACARAGKVKGHTVRDAECLVDVVHSVSRELYVQVDRSEAPREFVDFAATSLRVGLEEAVSKSRVGESGRLGKKVAPLKNWKGEEMGLGRGGAYVLVVVDG